MHKSLNSSKNKRACIPNAIGMATHDMDFKEEKYMKQVLLHCHT